jgi:hypothetical protein
VILNDKERGLLLEALAGHAMHVRACINTCKRAMPGFATGAPDVIEAYREDLATIDRLYARLQAAGGLP